MANGRATIALAVTQLRTRLLGDNHVIVVGRGIWVSLYEKEVDTPVSMVGGGIGLAYPAIAKVPLSGQEVDALDNEPEADAPMQKPEIPFTIAEAKRRLAAAFGVSEVDIKIAISS